MRHTARLLVLALAFAPAVWAQSESDYTEWIKPYPTESLIKNFGPRQGPAMLAITVIEGEEDGRPSGRDLREEYGCAVSLAGRISGFFLTRLSSSGNEDGGYMSDGDPGRLYQLLENLPEDHASLPPPGRRIVFQTPSASGVRVHVYDRANSPESVLQILRLIGMPIRPK